jgi:hypothetical protein
MKTWSKALGGMKQRARASESLPLKMTHFVPPKNCESVLAQGSNHTCASIASNGTTVIFAE